MPYACLAAMTFPAILTATAGGIISGAAGLIVALILAYREKSLLTVALFACAAVIYCRENNGIYNVEKVLALLCAGPDFFFENS